MPELEARYPCPVCLGVAMVKTPLRQTSGSRGTTLLLDHCERCGGVWFEAGEVQRLRGLRADVLWQAIAPRQEAFRMQCHSCESFMDRNAAACPACEWRNVLDCPMCQRPMETATHHEVTLDACKSCKGVWFDHSELASIWRIELAASMRKRGREPGAASVAGDGGLIVLDALMWSPWLVADGIYLAGHAASAAAGALSHAPETIGVVVEVTGEAAAGVFETIMEIIDGIFS